MAMHIIPEGNKASGIFYGKIRRKTLAANL